MYQIGVVAFKKCIQFEVSNCKTVKITVSLLGDESDTLIRKITMPKVQNIF